MKVHSHRVGAGPPLVLLHGWGFDGRVFSPWLPVLSQSFEVHVVDLPGHGQSSACDAEDVFQVAAHLIPHMSLGAVYVGWSLGGMVASVLASESALCAKALVTLASTPQWLAANDWPGMSLHDWQVFEAQLRAQPEWLWRRFVRMATCVAGVRGVAPGYAGTPKASIDVLQQSLQWLCTDLRAVWRALPCTHDSHWGKDDVLVSADVCKQTVCAGVAHHQSHVWPGGHDFAWQHPTFLTSILALAETEQTEVGA